MAGRGEGPPGSLGPDTPDTPDTADTAERDGRIVQPSGMRVVRAAFVLVVVIVIGIVLLPSATRSPRAVSTVTTSRHTQTSPPTTTTTHPVIPTTLPAVAHQNIKVLVANGTTTANSAGEARVWLGNHKFDTSAFAAYNTTTPKTADAVYFVNSGTKTMADEVAAALTLGTSVVQPAGSTPPVATTTGADVVVVLGTDLATRADAGTLGQPPAASTTTTTS
jgi:hypothetical protein